MQLDKTLAFDEFAKASLADWKAKATKDLKGKNLDDLVYTTSDGVTIEPYFTDENSSSHMSLGQTDFKITLLTSKPIEGVDRMITNLDELGKNCGPLDFKNLCLLYTSPSPRD